MSDLDAAYERGRRRQAIPHQTRLLFGSIAGRPAGDLEEVGARSHPHLSPDGAGGFGQLSCHGRKELFALLQSTQTRGKFGQDLIGVGSVPEDGLIGETAHSVSNWLESNRDQ